MMNRSWAAYGLVAIVALSAASADAWAADPVQATGTVYHDRNRNGTRDEGEEGLANIGVSNQRDVVRTDADGRWKLPCGDDTIFFVIKPRGWMTPVDSERMLPRFYYIHKPAGSLPSKYPGVAATGPLPASIDFPLHRQEEPDKFQVIVFGDTQPRDHEEIEFMARDVIPELVGRPAAFGATLGDVVFDNLSVYDHHNRTVALIGAPWYNVLGNHDINYESRVDQNSDETFEATFGPSYYAFDYGPTHFIVLDDVTWTWPLEEKKGSYHGELGEKQLAFVKNDLAHVAEDRLVVLMMHIPLSGVEDRQALYRLIENRPYTLSMAAHTHTQEHRFIGAEDGWRGAEPHHHFVNVTVCGSWWSGMPNEFGVPHAMTSDGVPNGYSIVTFDGQKASIIYKAAGLPADFQMSIHAPDSIDAAASGEAEVVVNVFAGSQKSVVEMRLGETGSWSRLERVDRPDPFMAAVKQTEEKFDKKLPGRMTPKLQNSSHIWAGKLPAGVKPGVTMIHVRTTDMYGQSYAASRVIRVK
jgi:hypothetical protein